MRIAISSNVTPMTDRAERTAFERRRTDRAGERALPPSAALVPVAAISHERREQGFGRGRPDAAFVVHLIATATQAPQTRTHRRAPAADVVAHYRSSMRVAAAVPETDTRRRSRTA